MTDINKPIPADPSGDEEQNLSGEEQGPGKGPPGGKQGVPEEELPPPKFDARTFRRVKFVLASVAALSLLIVLAFASITRIDASHVGVKVELTGSDKIRGVQDVPIVTGWTLFNPVTEQVIEFPISVQNVVWTSSLHEGKPVDESITFSSTEGVSVNADVGLGFHVDPSLVPHLFLRFHQADLYIVANGYVRNSVREAFNTTASTMSIDDIYGRGKAELVRKVTKRVAKKLKPDGFIIDQITINGALRLPTDVVAAINKSIAVKEDALREENKIRQVEAEANQERIRASGYADATLTRAAADAKAYAMLRDLNPLLLQRAAVEKWDGKLPSVTSGAMPFFDVSKIQR